MVGIKYTDHGLTWERPGIGQMVLYMFVEAVVLFVLVLLIEVRLEHSKTVSVTVLASFKKKAHLNFAVDETSVIKPITIVIANENITSS